MSEPVAPPAQGRIAPAGGLRGFPVVMVTSSAEGRDIAETYKLGVNSYIVKPVEFEQFSETVARAGFYWMLMNKAPH